MKRNFCIAKKTLLKKYNTKKGLSSKEEWVCVEGSPCEILGYDKSKGIFIIDSFTSSPNRIFTITIFEYIINFEYIQPNKRNELILKKYPVNIDISEFDKRKIVSKMKRNIVHIINNNNINLKTRQLLKNKLIQIIYSQGSQYISTKQYKKYIDNINLKNNKKFGYPVFNRGNRWCPPVSTNYQEYIKSLSYPAPIGIRKKDFCLPSELIMVIKKLCIEIVNMKNFPENDCLIIQKYLPFVYKKDFYCHYCGHQLDYLKYSSIYKSKENYMELCHKDPYKSYQYNNVYWGHGECNRKQGGYSEKERIIDGLRLLFNHDIITKEMYNTVNKNLSKFIK